VLERCTCAAVRAFVLRRPRAGEVRSAGCEVAHCPRHCVWGSEPRVTWPCRRWRYLCYFLYRLWKKKLIHRDRFVSASVCPSQNSNLGYYFAISKYFFIKLSNDIAFDKTDTVIPNSLSQGYICWCSNEQPSSLCKFIIL